MIPRTAFSLTVLAFAAVNCAAQTSPDTICSHRTVYDQQGKLLPWYEPNVPGAAYTKVCELAAGFIKNCPKESTTGLPYYMVHNWIYNFEHVSEETFLKGDAGSDESHNPACLYAGLVQGLVLEYRVYSGDDSYVDILAQCLDHQIDHGSTPEGWLWPKVPYASSDPKATEYVGGTLWGIGGRADGLHVIEPDKVGELGIAYLQFYKVTDNEKYLDAALNCADALAANAFRGVPRDERWQQQTPWFDKAYVSPWPFRVHAENGTVYEKYCSNVIGAINLFDELVRIADRISLDPQRLKSYKTTRKNVWNWLFSELGPVKSMVWKGYFEDIPTDEGNVNRNQITPMETARYLINNPLLRTDIDDIVPSLIGWVKYAFATEGAPAIKEQFWCYVPMGSHTARFGSICAMWYERTGDAAYKDLAEKYLNWATYMTQQNGMVYVTPEKPIRRQIWFSDGYGDYIRHFMAAVAAIPEWAPADENHLLKSTSVVKKIEYAPEAIRYSTYDNDSTEVLRLTARPKSITVAGGKISERTDLNAKGCTWRPLKKGGVLKIRHTKGNDLVIDL
jgi:hypothetical protein